MYFMKKILFLMVIIIVGLSSCASLKFVQKEDDVIKIIDLINKGDSKTLTTVSVTPFLFDGEILMLDSDIDILWKNITDAGFTLQAPSVVKIEEIGVESSRFFGDSMDIRSYFDRYLPETARITHIQAGAVNMLLLLNGKKDGYPQIHGIKVD